MAGKKRDSNYYKRRLQREFPRIYSELLSGKHESVRQAAAAAGLIRLPTRLQALKREWKHATWAERKAFATWAKAGLRTTPAPSKPVAHPDGRLTASAAAFLVAWQSRTRLRPGRISKAMGRSNHDFRLAQAIGSGTALPQDLLKDLSEWMRKNGY
jgi:hypothetical protein